MAVWPLTLPQAPGGVTERAPYHAIRSVPETGPEKRRPRYTGGIRHFALSFLLWDDEVATLETFYQTTLLGGSLAFDWLHPRTGAAASMRFTSPPDMRPTGPRSYRVTFETEVLP